MEIDHAVRMRLTGQLGLDSPSTEAPAFCMALERLMGVPPGWRFRVAQGSRLAALDESRG